MKAFEIEITETLQVIQEVKANSYDEAFKIIRDRYKNEEIILTAEDHVETEIQPFLYSDSYSKFLNNPLFKEYILQNAEKILLNMSIEELVELSFGDIESAIYSFKNSF